MINSILTYDCRGYADAKEVLKHEKESYHNYLADYVKAKTSNTNIHESIDIEQKEREILVDEIARLIDVNCKKIKPSPFTPSFEDHEFFKCLKIQCTNESTILAFVTSICKFYYEGSNLGRSLPLGFISRDFCNIIRSSRNKYDHRNCEPRIWDDRKLFSKVNNGIEPYKSIHFSNMQSTILNMFKQELLDMRNSTTSSVISNGSFSSTATIPFLEDGKEYEGTIESVTNAYGTFLNVRCPNHAFPLQIKNKIGSLSQNDKVKFIAVSEPNIKNPNKSFWKADQVRLK